MKFSIKRTALLDALRTVSSTATRRSSLEILSGVKIDVTSDSIELLTSNEVTSVKQTIKKSEDNGLEITSSGSVVLDAKIITDGVSKLDSSLVTIEIVKGSLTIVSGGNAKININGSNANLFPRIEFDIPGKEIIMNANDLSTAIEQTSYACGNPNGSRAVLLGVNFGFNNNSLTLIASDTFRIARKTIQVTNDIDDNYTVPYEALNLVRNHLWGLIRVEFSKNVITFKDGDTVIQSRLIDGMYPQVNRAFPNEYEYKFKINRSSLISAIERTGLLRTESFWVVQLLCIDDEIMLQTATAETGSTEEVILENVSPQIRTSVKFNGKNIIEALKVLKSNEVEIQFNGEEKPLMIRDLDDETIEQLITPVRSAA